MYIAYFILRSSSAEIDKRIKLAAVYNIFSFAMILPLLFILPRMMDRLHPGNGGNPGIGGEDLDHMLRIVFYPAIIGFSLMGFWISNLMARLRTIEAYKLDQELKKSK